MSHLEDLRAEVETEDGQPVSNQWWSDWKTGWQDQELSNPDRLLCAYATKLTLTPQAMEERDVQGLRKAGFDDEAIHDAIQVISYFNYINRIADAIHVDLDPGMDPYPGG